MSKITKAASLLVLLTLSGFSQLSNFKIVKNGEFYFSWGYNTEWYTRSDIYINQPSLNNNYVLKEVIAHDHKGWDSRLFQTQLTIPQYNYRIGYFFDEKQNWAFEINFDHTKYVVDSWQPLELKGTFHGRQVDTIIQTGNPNFLWQLNNGANFLEFNLVRKLKLVKLFNENIKLDGLIKLGGGPNVPHVQNTIFGVDNDPHFQISGWNVDFDAAVRVTFFKHVFVELYDKVVYAHYRNLHIASGGIGKQSFACYELALCLGGCFKF
ncbi:MAG: hypothetical protein JSU07_04420 [Bacteroidetes bacterium]|nr:hypothetical protein [Bacteroidota bacterium]